jgi:hypothetical protein
MMPARSRGAALWIAAAAALVVSLTPWGDEILYPFKLFTTWIHESSHALATLLVGGRVNSVSIQPDTSGLTMSLIPSNRVLRGIVASAGYIGASLGGCALIAATRAERRAPKTLFALGVIMLVTALFWMRNAFGFIVVLLWGASLLLLARYAYRGVVQFVLGLLAVQVALNAVYDIRVLFLVHGSSDAQTMAALFLLPSWFWASLWMLASIVFFAATLRLTRPRGGA